MNLEAGTELPETLGECIDEYKAINELRIAMQKEVDAVRARESELQEHLLNSISKMNKKGEFGNLYKAKVEIKPSFRIEDWKKFIPFIKKHDRFDMLQKRISEKALKDYLEETGELPPGTLKVNVPWLSVTKI